MRDALTVVAVAIITLLSLALAIPFVVDWTGQRARIETVLSRQLGLPVQIGGPVDVRFLPTPRLIIEKAQIGEKLGPIVLAERIAIEIATMPLLKGEIHVLESRFSGARLLLTRRNDGGFFIPADSLPQASVEKLFISDGHVQIRDMQGQVEATWQVAHIEAEAGALYGPWRISGQMRAGAEQRDVRLALSAPDEMGQRTRLTLIDRDGARTDFDGRVRFDTGLIEGKLVRQGVLPWLATGETRAYAINAALAIRGRSLVAEPLDVEIGDDVTALKLAGSAQWSPTTPLSIKLDGKSVDLDRPFKLDQGSLVARDSIAGWVGVIAGLSGEMPPARIDLGLQNALLGGDAVRAIAIKADMDGNSIRLIDLTADAPGNTTLGLRGDFAFGGAPRFSGTMAIASRDPARFAAWFEGEAGRARFPLRADFNMDADLFVTRETVAASKLKLTYDQTQVTGAMRFYRLGVRPKLEAQLASDRLALESLPDFSGLGGALGDVDTQISFEARQLDFGREWRGGKMRLRLEKNGGLIALPLFELTDQGGLSIRATGNLQGEGGRLDALIDAPQIAPLALIAQRFGGGTIADAMQKRASAFSPMRGRLSLFRDRGGYRAELSGRAAATDFVSMLRLTDERLDGNFELRASEVSGLLKQVGLSVVPFGRNVAARMTGTFAGSLTDMSVQARFESGQTRFTFDGQKTKAGLTGPLRAESDDLTPWLQLLALPVPSISERLPLNFDARLNARDEGLALEQVEARLGGVPFRGQVLLQGDVMGGALAFDHLSFESLASLALGPVAPPAAASPWPSQRFVPPIAPPVRLALQLTAPSLTLPFGWRGDKPRIDLQWSPDGLNLNDVTFGFAGGVWRGQLAIKRQGGLASFSSRTQWDNVDIAALLPQSGLVGRTTMIVDLGGSGETIAAMVNSLSGGGRMRIDEGSIGRLDAKRVMPIIAAADQGRDAPDQRALRDAISAALDSGPLAVDGFDTTLAIANGVFRIGPASVTGAFAQGHALALYDLKTMKLDARLTLQSLGARDWAQAPQWSVQWRSLPNGAVVRDVDTTTLANVLTTRFVGRELMRIEAEEADLRERNFFIRRQRSEKARYEEKLRQEQLQRAEEDAKRAREDAEKILNVMPPPVEPAVPSFQ